MVPLTTEGCDGDRLGLMSTHFEVHSTTEYLAFRVLFVGTVCSVVTKDIFAEKLKLDLCELGRPYQLESG